MANKQDLRVVRTQKNLKNALFDLLDEKDLESITVRELAERAEVSRATFYMYFDSVPAMMQSVFDELYSSFIDNAKSVFDKKLDFQTTLTEISSHPFSSDEENYAFLRLARNKHLDRGTIHYNIAKGINSIKSDYIENFSIEGEDYLLDYILEFLAGGIASAILHWADSSDSDSTFEKTTSIILSILNKSDSGFSVIKRRK